MKQMISPKSYLTLSSLDPKMVQGTNGAIYKSAEKMVETTKNGWWCNFCCCIFRLFLPQKPFSNNLNSDDPLKTLPNNPNKFKYYHIKLIQWLKT